jgi:type IX secretion system PorP/SprF family membrane protein
MKKLITIIAILGTSLTFGQDIHFSQLSNTPLFLSPATAGASPADFRSSIHYRNQWANMGSPFTTYALAVDGKLQKKSWRDKHFGLGGTLFTDRAGDLGMKTLNANIQIAYHQKLNPNNHLSAGLQAGFVQHSISQNLAQWDNQYDGTGYNSSYASGESFAFQPFTAFDASAGVLWTYSSKSGTVSSNNGKVIQIGFAAHHLNKPKLSFLNLPAEKYYHRYVFHGNSSIGLNNTSWAVQPAFVYQRKGKEQELVLGTMFKYLITEKSHVTGFKAQFDFALGAYYRFRSDAIIPTLYLNYANWGFGIGYDVNISSLSGATKFRGGLEMSLKFVTPNPYSKSAASFPSL